MRQSKNLQTILVNTFLAFIGTILAFLTGWLVVVPIIFALGVPLINLNYSYKQKIAWMGVILVGNLVVFILAVGAILGFDLEGRLNGAIVVGFAGLLILVINGLIIDNIKIDVISITATFVLSAASLPLSIGFSTYLEDSTMNSPIIDYLQQFDTMFFWMVATTIGVTFGIKNVQKAR